MHNYNIQLQHINMLIEKIQHRFASNFKFDKPDLDKLLDMSAKAGYQYGLAMAHIYSAQHFQISKVNSEYFFHAQTAKKIAEERNYSDILIEYYKFEGINSVSVGDEVAALMSFLQAYSIAINIGDKKSMAILCNNIANIFFSSNELDYAEEYYLKALDSISKSESKDIETRKKTILINMVELYCEKGDVKNAEIYKQKCLEIKSSTNVITAFFLQAELKMLILENQREKALGKAEEIKIFLIENENEAQMYQNLYIAFIKLLLQLNSRDYAIWCFEQMKKLYQDVDANMASKIRQQYIQYAIAFGEEDDDIYKEFYNATLETEQSNRKLTAVSIKSFIKLYTKKKEQLNNLREQSYLQSIVDSDDLTKVYNRRYYNKLVSKFSQDDRLSSLGYVMIDVDFFKEYNDFYGHLKGDEILVIVADILSTNLPDNAYVARYGGDEFSCLFIDKTEDEIVNFVKNVKQKLKRRNILHAKSKNSNLLTLSFGIYNETDMQNCDESHLIRKADNALYEAKNKGRNTYSVYK